jgi:hypothetical protein
VEKGSVKRNWREGSEKKGKSRKCSVKRNWRKGRRNRRYGPGRIKIKNWV